MNAHTFLSVLCLGLACSIIGVTINVIMPNEPILNWWFRIGEKYGKDIVDGREVEYWFYRPIWGCEKCFAGQIALWSYFLWHLRIEWGAPAIIRHGCVGWVALEGYSLFCHLLAVCSAIIFAVIISSYINQKTN